MQTPDHAARSPGPDTQNRLRDLFDQAVDIPAGGRDAWIDAQLADPTERAALRRLLAADDTHGFLDTPATEHAERMAAEEVLPESLIGQQIGAFRIVRALGHGGMAAVFLGERVGADFAQQVAIKLLRRGLYSELEQRLFLRERQVLAALDHPNIAHLIDGGVTAAGIPFLVMEHVDGAPITLHASEQKLDVRQRLKLFLRVCRAVEAAHRNLIVHRDIKPSNILVSTDGDVKLLDFGIAKLLDEDDAGATIGVYTPDYAAPEQVSGGAITTATDVYGLGVLLHELLLGLRPDGSPTRRPSSRVSEISAPQAASAVRVFAPTQLRSVLRGDLDNILLKALEPEPQRRYASAGALADDIERFLDHRPVSAHPPSRLYRTRKFIQRHRGGVLTSALFLLGILAALGIALWQANVARQEAARANTVRDFIVTVFDAARAHLPREQRPTPEALVEQAQRQLAAATNLDAATRGDMLRTLGEVNLSLSNFARAEAMFGEARDLADRSGDAAAARSARVLRADAAQRAGRNAEAMRELYAQLDGLRDTASPALLRALGVLAAAELATGAPDAAIAHRREAASAADRIYGADNVEARASALDVGNTLADLERYPEAVALLDPLLARWRAANAPQDDRYVAALTSLATASDGIGDKPGSEAHYRELLALKRHIYSAPHDAIAKALRDLGSIILRAEKFAEAEALLNEALAMQRQVFGEDHREVAASYDALGEIMVVQRRFADADAAYRAAIAICERARINEEVCPRARNNLGMSFYRQDRLDDAKREMTQALAERRALLGNDHPTVAYSLSTLANVAAKQNDGAEAVRLSQEALAVLDHSGRGASREAVLIRNTYAAALFRAGRNAEALPEIDRTITDWQRVAPDGKVRHVMMLVQKAQILQALKRNDEARATAEEGVALNAPVAELAPRTKQLLRELSGRTDIYPESAAPAR
jgi:eukaryotic-like serine/threonine-protein kinase